MSIVRTDRKGEFTVIPNELINDPDLDGDALGLLVYLLSKPADWWVKIQAIESLKRFGSHGKVVKTLQTLRTLGYASLNRMSTGHTEWVITDTRQQTSHIPKSGIRECEPHSEKPHSEKPHSEKPHSENRNVLQKKDLDKRLIEDKRKKLSHNARAEAQKNGPPDWMTDPVSLALWDKPWPFAQAMPESWIDAVVAKHKCSREAAKAEADAFIEYWASGKGRKQKKLDWHKAWLVWCAKPYALNEPMPTTKQSRTGYKTVEEQNRMAAVRAKAMLFGNNNVLEGECSHA